MVHSAGIIPARAGFTAWTAPWSSTSTDHPRSRGVYGPHSGSPSRTAGSSPLARGLPGAPGGTESTRRIIPARAGFTAGRRGLRCARRDHPRSRGVYSSASAATCSSWGSSPLARGLLQTIWAGIQVAGIIPARAGFTEIVNAGLKTIMDHPRSRGVYTCGSLVSQRTRSLPDPRRLHCRPRARSAGSP